MNKDTVWSLLFTIARNIVTDKIRRYYKQEDFVAYIYNRMEDTSRNTTEDTIHFLKKHGIHPAQVNLLPYHNTGSSKYPKLGMEYKGTDLHAPEKEEMESFVKLFQDAGYTNTKIGG